jgi:hypothetical protein
VLENVQSGCEPFAFEQDSVVAIVPGVVVPELFVSESLQAIVRFLSGVAAVFRQCTDPSYLRGCSIPAVVIRLTPKMT